LPFDYKAHIQTVVDILKAHNTTTAAPALSLSLTTAIVSDNIRADDPEKVRIRGDEYPAIFVRISTKNENFKGLGETGQTRNKKMASVSFDIIGMYQKDGASQAHKDVLLEIYTLARNIEGVFQQEYNLSGTALYCNPLTTNFIPAMENEGSWVKMVLIELNAVYLFR
jgi:hypothetical protein